MNRILIAYFIIALGIFALSNMIEGNVTRFLIITFGNLGMLNLALSLVIDKIPFKNRFISYLSSNKKYIGLGAFFFGFLHASLVFLNYGPVFSIRNIFGFIGLTVLSLLFVLSLDFAYLKLKNILKEKVSVLFELSYLAAIFILIHAFFSGISIFWVISLSLFIYAIIKKFLR